MNPRDGSDPQGSDAGALDVFDCPLDGISLIEASAGTGKTWNLCGLYLRLLLERGLEVQRILVVTFTKAATAELHERIRMRIVDTLARLRGTGPPVRDQFVDGLLDALRRRCPLQDGQMAALLDRALQTFDEASIFTIHAFCQRALGDAPFTAGVPMALELLADDSTLRMQVVHDFWRRRIAGAALPAALVNHLIERGDTPERHAALLKRRLAKPLSTLRWPAALDDPTRHTAPARPDVDSSAVEDAFTQARELWQRERTEILACIAEALPRLNGNSYKSTTVDASAKLWDGLFEGARPLANAARIAGPGHLALLAADMLAAKTKKNQAPPGQHAFFGLAQRLLDQREQSLQALELARLRLLRDLLRDGPAALRDAKREQRVISFDDMLLNLYERLSGDTGRGLAAALRARFPAALIDEFQDTDPLQFAIFQAIHGDGACPLFLVGDPKQAIYSFRHADLHTYLLARRHAATAYTLNDNQRSTAPLIDALNAVFAHNPRAFMLPGLDYPPVRCGSKPRPPFDDRSEPRAALQLWSLPVRDDGHPAMKSRAQQNAGEACAGEIVRLLHSAREGAITLDGRPLAAGDIAVLVRTHAQGHAMRDALARRGVGSVELSQASLFASPDAQELERVLAAVLDPAREPVLRAALATSMMGLDAAALDALGADDRGLLDTVVRFAAYRDVWLERGVGVMLRQLMQAESVNPRLLARPDGERRLTNLMHLAECLHDAAQTLPAPQALLRWLQAQRTQDRKDDESQLRLESDRNLVQIVTIHRSKGLEYPVVFCPFLWDGVQTRAHARADGVEYHDADGQAVFDLRSDDEIGKDGRAAIAAQLQLERAAESLRLIYVALTRAVHRCYLVVGPYTVKTGQTESVRQGCRALLNWLVAGAGLSPEAWLENDLTPARIEAAWAALAAAHGAAIALSPLPPASGTVLAPHGIGADDLTARAAPAHIPRGWRIGSYSSLAYGARNEGAAVDHDLRVEVLPSGLEVAGDAASDEVAAAMPATAGAVPDAEVGEDDILRFPRGPAAGDCLHAVFERIDFTAPDGWPAIIDKVLRSQPPAPASAEVAAGWPAMVSNMVADVLHTPLTDGLMLAAVPPAQCLVELEFTFPVHRLAAAPLAALLRAHGYPVPALAFGALEGYLRGYIDLVFEHGGRFHILDWKSNHLGHTVADYASGPVARAMDEHGYHLQYLLYTVALHRHLQQTLPGYRYELHFGGVLYLFVRGVRPRWRAADGAPAGVYAHQPTLAVIDELSALMTPHEAAA